MTLGQQEISVEDPSFYVLTGTPETADVPITERELFARPAERRPLWPWAVGAGAVGYLFWTWRQTA